MAGSRYFKRTSGRTGNSNRAKPSSSANKRKPVKTFRYVDTGKASSTHDRSRYPSRASVGGGYITKSTRPSDIKRTGSNTGKATKKPASRPVRTFRYPDTVKASTAHAAGNQASKPARKPVSFGRALSQIFKSPGSGPASRSARQALYGMNDQAKTEYQNLSASVSNWADLAEHQRVQMARQPQILEQLPHAYINNPNTPEQFEHQRTSRKSRTRSTTNTSQTSAAGSASVGDIVNQSLLTNQLPGWSTATQPGQRQYGRGTRRGTRITGAKGVPDASLILGQNLLSGF